MPETLARLNQALHDRYVIEREIGQGGMATVYLARDVRHDRRVALKLLRADLGAVLGVERFLAEIKVTAGLQHPNLLPLFDSGAADGLLFYVMPFVEGESLRHRLDREKQLPVDEAVRLAVAVAGALDYAHRQGVIHRDLKPENILMQAGQPVVADFGIALAISNAGGARVTQTGLSLGTPQYMSPEQATGDRAIDARTDVYSLAAVLYEMLTGEPPHTGSTAQAIIARLVTEAPRPVRATRPTVPEYVELAIARALEKLPADRHPTAEAFAQALQRADLAVPAAQRSALGARGTARSGARPSSGARALQLAPWLLLLALGSWTVPRLLAPTPPPEPVVRFTPRLDDVRLRRETSPALSPDGALFAFVAETPARTLQLFVQSLDAEQAIPVGSGIFEPATPFFSPDGRTLGVVRRGQLWRIAVTGNAASVICDVPAGAQQGSWGSRDDIVYSSGGELFVVRAAGSEPRRLAARDSAAGILAYGAPHFLPDGATVLAEQQRRDGVQLVAVRLADGTVNPLGIAGQAPHYADGEVLAYVAPSRSAFAVRFDPATLRVTGEPERVADAISAASTVRFSVSRNGRIAYLSEVSYERREGFLVNRRGERQLLSLPPGSYRFPRFSPDGRSLAIVAQAARRLVGDVWTYELASRRAVRLTFDTTALMAEWAPDGRAVYYMGRHRTARGWVLYRVAADGSRPPDSLLAVPGGVSTPAFTPRGDTVIYATLTPGTPFRLVLESLSDSTSRRVLSEGVGTAMSPDGRWLAYSAEPSGMREVFVRRLDAASGRWLVSVGGGSEPRWGDNGRELYYRSTGDSLMAVSFQGEGREPMLGTPRALFEAPFLAWPTEVHYDVTRDGSQFVFLNGPQGNAVMQVVLNRLAPLMRGR